MVKLHLVGFTTDLKNLIFATRRGAKRGGYMVNLDKRLLRTLEEIDRLDKEEAEEKAVQSPEPAAKTSPAKEVRRSSVLNPKQIQALLREGKSEEQVAKLAETDVAWISRFTSPILAERAGVIDTVRGGTIAKSRLGPSSIPVGAAVQKNLAAKRVSMTPETFEGAWKAVRKGGRWQVSFQYASRGQRRLARFSFDPDTRQVGAMNQVALELGWAPPESKRGRKRVADGTSAKRKPKTKGRAKAGSSG